MFILKKNMLLVVFIFVMTIHFLYGEKTILVVCEDKEDFPHIMGNGPEIATEIPGATIEFLNAISKRLNITFLYRRMPWKRALERELFYGNADMLISASYLKEREVFGVYPKKGNLPDRSRSLYTTSYCFYRFKGSSIEWDGNSLLHFRGTVGAPRGYSIIAYLKKLGYHVDESPDTTTDFKKLLAHRVDIVAGLELHADMLLRHNKQFNDNIEKLSIPIISKDYYVIFSHAFYGKNKDLVEKIWNEISAHKKTEYQIIAHSYFEH